MPPPPIHSPFIFPQFISLPTFSFVQSYLPYIRCSQKYQKAKQDQFKTWSIPMTSVHLLLWFHIGSLKKIWILYSLYKLNPSLSLTCEASNLFLFHLRLSENLSHPRESASDSPLSQWPLTSVHNLSPSILWCWLHWRSHSFLLDAVLLFTASDHSLLCYQNTSPWLNHIHHSFVYM